jgi:hypothetical protein
MISKASAEHILRRRIGKIRDCIVQAYGSWRSDHQGNGSDGLILTPRSRASVIHDYMVAFARDFFKDDPGIRIFTKRGLSLINIDDSLLLRFKKLDAEKRSRNIPTQQTYLFRAQLELPGIPAELTHIEAGYVLNELQTMLDGIYITCPNGKRLEWFIDLTSLLGANVVPLSPPSALPKAPAAARKKRLKPKTEHKDKKNEGDQP